MIDLAEYFKAFENNFENNGDIGACFAATLEGEYVVDIWAGHQDKENTALARRHHHQCVFDDQNDDLHCRSDARR